MATHSSILAWEIPWTEDLEGYTPHVARISYNSVTKSSPALLGRNNYLQLISKEVEIQKT